MTTRELAELAHQTRQAQVRYYCLMTARGPDALAELRRLEMRLDEAVAEALGEGEVNEQQ